MKNLMCLVIGIKNTGKVPKTLTDAERVQLYLMGYDVKLKPEIKKIIDKK